MLVITRGYPGFMICLVSQFHIEPPILGFGGLLNMGQKGRKQLSDLILGKL